MKEKLLKLKERIKENFKENRIPVIVLLFLWVVVVVFTLYSYRNTLGKISNGNEAYDNVVELCDDMTVKETVPVEPDSDTIVIKFATYARNNNGSFNVKVIGNKSKTVYGDKTVRAGTLQDNANVVFPLSEKLDPAKDQSIDVIISSDAVKDQGAGVYYSNLKVFENSTLTVGDVVQEGDLSMRFMKESEELRLFYHIVIVWVICTFSLIMLLLLLVKPKYEILFTVIAIAFGLTFWLIITPMSVPDETIHYEYSFQLSNYIMGEEDHLLFDEEYQNYGAMAGHLNISAAYERFINKINRPMSLDNKIVRMNFDIDESYKICFIPQALGITVARLLNWNMLRTFYLGRLFNLIFYVVCVYIAIKNTPVHKVMLGILATLPIMMQQAASFSYDCYINGLSIVIVAFLLKWMFGKESISKKEYIFVFIVNLLIAPVKVVYGLFSFLYWFVPVSKFASKKQKIIAILIITLPAMYELTVLMGPLIYRILRKMFEKLFLNRVEAETIQGINAPLGEGDRDTYKFSDITDNPLEALAIVFRTIRYNLKVWFYGSFGRALSGNTLILPSTIVHSMLGLIVLSALLEENYHSSKLFKITIFMTCVMAGLMIVAGMLISWTEVDQDVIEAYGGPVIQGIQGRYFSPMLPYLLLILHNSKIKLNKKFSPYLIYAFVLIVFEVIVYVLSYTFMN